MTDVQVLTTLGRDARRKRAIQVGILMRHYRGTFVSEDGRKGLTQDELLDRMATVDDRYNRLYSHATVSRWESAQTLPKRERLVIFGKALNLSQVEVEVDGLIVLAGFETTSQSVVKPVPSSNWGESSRSGHHDNGATDEKTGFASMEPAGVFWEKGGRSFLTDALNFCFFRFLLPAGAMVGAGYLLSSLGVTTTWILMLYIGLAMGLVVFQGFFRMRRASNLRDLLFISLVFVLSTALLQVPFVGIDPYGFYNLGNLGGTPLPIVLTLMANLLVSLIASLMFDLLWRWQYSWRGANKAWQRAMWVTIPPMAFTYVWLLLMANSGTWVSHFVLLSIMGAVFGMLAVLRDETVEFTGWDRNFLLFFSMQMTVIMTMLGAGTAVANYLQPTPLWLTGHGSRLDHNILSNVEIC